MFLALSLAFGVQAKVSVESLEFLGEVTFPTGFAFQGTEVGGLSSISYDAENKQFLAIADDRSQFNPARFYTLTIDLGDGRLDDGDVTFVNVTNLLQADGSTYPALSLDPEGLTLVNDRLFFSSEGDANALVNPFVKEINVDGSEIQALTVPEKYFPTADQSRGIRNNLAFESLTATPDGRFLFTATENALFQDDNAATLDNGSLSRVLVYDLSVNPPTIFAEHLYPVEAVAAAPIPADSFATNGLVELLALDDLGTTLAMERSFSNGVGNAVRLYEVTFQGALSVKDQESVRDPATAAPFELDPDVAETKRLVLDLGDFVVPDNLEGMTLGPVLADGRQSLIVVSDNNFSPTQKTQFLAFAMRTNETKAIAPKLETPTVIDQEDGVPAGTLTGDADDPAFWLHPTNPEASLVITAVKDGGLVVFDLAAEVVQTIVPPTFGEQRFNNVDVLYNFPLNGQFVDLAVASDRQNDTLAVFQIDPNNGVLSDITATDMIDSIFGVDDGEATAYGLAGFADYANGKFYVFVSQADGNQVAQLELTATAQNTITANVLRRIDVPVPAGADVEDAQVEGMVVDRELGVLYAGQEEFGVWAYAASPTGSTVGRVVDSIASPWLAADVEGLTLYYASNGQGYLLVSSQGSNSFAVYRREADNAYLGSFQIGRNQAIDSNEECDGMDVINVPMGNAFPFGLLVTQDGANDPQFVAEDDEEIENRSANFKFSAWSDVANALPFPLLIDTQSFSPRPRPGTQVLLETRTESIGLNCANGGVRVVSGIDLNANAILDENEITNTVFVCNGANGQNGQDGQDGADGQDGDDGDDGDDGAGALTPVSLFFLVLLLSVAALRRRFC